MKFLPGLTGGNSAVETVIKSAECSHFLTGKNPKGPMVNCGFRCTRSSMASAAQGRRQPGHGNAGPQQADAKPCQAGSCSAARFPSSTANRPRPSAMPAAACCGCFHWPCNCSRPPGKQNRWPLRSRPKEQKAERKVPRPARKPGASAFFVLWQAPPGPVQWAPGQMPKDGHEWPEKRRKDAAMKYFIAPRR